MRRKSISYILVLFICSIFFSSCKKNIQGITPPNQYSDASFSSIFEAYWTGMNNNYVFWSIDTTNWDQVYKVYKDSFYALDTTPKLTRTQRESASVGYFRSMTKGLIDCHYRLTFQGNSTVIYPSGDRKKVAHPIPTSYFVSTIPQLFQFSVFDTFSAYDQDLNSTLHETTGLINKGSANIAYIHFDLFDFYHLCNDLKYDRILSGYDSFNTYLSAATGLIVDLRNNSGGHLNDLSFLFGRLLTKDLVFANTRGKNGNGRLDYTPWTQAYFQAVAPHVSISRIVVIIDQRSKSMAEMTAMALRTMGRETSTDVRLVGNTTWGATGALNSDYQLYQDGQFYFASSFGFVYTPSAMLSFKYGGVLENKGVYPDTLLQYDYDRDPHHDSQLAKAISLF